MKMKTSNKLLAALVTTLLAATVFVDVLLKNAYAKIDLNDAFKNYETIAIKPFKYLITEGGNGYAIQIKQSAVIDLKVMSTRKNFLTVVQRADTLFLKFTVPNNMSNRDQETLPQGLLLSSPKIDAIAANGTNILLTGWQADNLTLTLTGIAALKFNQANIGELTVTGSQNAMVNFNEGNNIKDLKLVFSDNAIATLRGIDYSSLSPHFTGKSQLVFDAGSTSNLVKK